MRKKVSVLAVCIISLISVLMIPAVLATPPEPVSGSFDYTYSVLGMREADGNAFIYAEEWEDWTGDFEGSAHAYFTVMAHKSGWKNVQLLTTFTGTVDFKSGTLVLRLFGKKPLDGEWYGQWVILSGTDELANLRGQGTWGGPGFGAPGPDIWYKGKIHFEP